MSLIDLGMGKTKKRIISEKTIKLLKSAILFSSFVAIFFSFVFGGFIDVSEIEMAGFQESAKDIIVVLVNQPFAIIAFVLLTLANIRYKTEGSEWIIIGIRSLGVVLVFFAIFALGSINVFADSLRNVSENYLYAIHITIVTVPLFLFLFAILVNKNREYAIAGGFFVLSSVYLISKVLLAFFASTAAA